MSRPRGRPGYNWVSLRTDPHVLRGAAAPLLGSHCCSVTPRIGVDAPTIGGRSGPARGLSAGAAGGGVACRIRAAAWPWNAGRRLARVLGYSEHPTTRGGGSFGVACSGAPCAVTGPGVWDLVATEDGSGAAHVAAPLAGPSPPPLRLAGATMVGLRAGAGGRRLPERPLPSPPSPGSTRSRPASSAVTGARLRCRRANSAGLGERARACTPSADHMDGWMDGWSSL